MKVEPTELDGVLILQPEVYSDDRGAFHESFNAKTFAMATGFDGAFVQDNESVSAKGVIRGLHYQMPPHAQGKLVRCAWGETFDVAVDLRRSSPTFGHWTGAVLRGDNQRQLWIPEGFAHGFLAMTDGARVLYKTTDYYAPEAQRSIRWDDSAIGIEWPDIGVEPMLSERDRSAPTLDRADTFA